MSLSLGVEETIAKAGDTSQIYTLDLYDDEIDLFLTDDYDPEDIEVRVADENGKYLFSTAPEDIIISDDDTLSVNGNKLASYPPGLYQVEVHLKNDDDTETIFPTGARPVIRLVSSI